MSLNGIDVSSSQGVINWAAVRSSGVQFAIIKASEGVRYVNPDFANDLPDCRASGILPATYHFALPAWNAPMDEAVHFIQSVQGRLQAGDVLALDLEDDPYGGTLPADCGLWALTWLERVEQALGAKPLLYTNLNLITNRGLAAVGAKNYGLWLADPGVPNPPSPTGWAFTAIQQTSWSGAVTGISGKVDEDVFFGSEVQFRKYGVH